VIVPTILIEPIARGIRLEILSNAISALRKRLVGPIFVVTRADFASVELTKWIDPECANLHFVPSDVELADADTGTLEPEQFAALLETCVELVGPDDLANLIFLGADGYCDALISQCALIEQRFAKSRCFALVHRNETFMAGRGCFTKRAMASLAAAHVTWIALNESSRGQRVGHRPVVVLPDPWHGQLAPEQRNSARRQLGFTSDTLVMAAFADMASQSDSMPWILAEQALAKSPHTHLTVIGDEGAPSDSMLRSFGDRISYLGPLADSSKQRSLLVAADIVLLPRARSREGARAADDAFARPPSSRALHARTFAFGAAYDREAARQLQESIDFIHRFSAREVAMLRSSLERLAHDRLLGAFRKGLRSAILSAQ